MSDDLFARLSRSFSAAPLPMALGARLSAASPGAVEIRAPVLPIARQQHGFVHGGAVATLADIAGGYASQSLMEPGDSVLTIEFKINLLAPGRGEALRAVGSVMRPGGRIFVARMEVFCGSEGACDTLIAIAQGTFMRMKGVQDGGG